MMLNTLLSKMKQFIASLLITFSIIDLAWVSSAEDPSSIEVKQKKGKILPIFQVLQSSNWHSKQNLMFLKIQFTLLRLLPFQIVLAMATVLVMERATPQRNVAVEEEPILGLALRDVYVQSGKIFLSIVINF